MPKSTPNTPELEFKRPIEHIAEEFLALMRRDHIYMMNIEVSELATEKEQVELATEIIKNADRLSDLAAEFLATLSADNPT